LIVSAIVYLMTKRLKQIFADDKSSLGLLPTLVRVFLFVVTAIFFNWIMRPDLYGLVPNSLDPVFYTGYAINLDDALSSAGNSHYFVTRWTSYLPNYFFSQLVGPYFGRLIWRMLLLIWLSESLWRLGHSLSVKATSRLAALMVTLSTPLFIRPFMTDYPEYLCVSLGLILLINVINFSYSIRRLIFIGIIVAALIIANPFMIGLSTVSLLMICWYDRMYWSIKTFSIAITAIIGSVLSVFLVGALWFHYYFGVDNIYQPTVDFLRSNQRNTIDTGEGLTNAWIWNFGWLYIPLVLVVAGYFISFQVSDSQKALIKKSSFATFAVFLFHLLMQIRSGHALETSYYWSMSLPPTLILLFVLSALLMTRIRWFVNLLVLMLILTTLYVGVPELFHLRGGWVLFLTLCLFLLALVLLTSVNLTGTTLVFLALVTVLTVGSPNHNNETPTGSFTSPLYEEVYRKRSKNSNAMLQEIIWFENVMDKLKGDAQATFISASREAWYIVGIYIPHPFERVLFEHSKDRLLSAKIRTELQVGHRRLLTILGSLDNVSEFMKRIQNELPDHEIVLDETHNSGLGYRVAAYSKTPNSQFQVRLSPSELPSQVGQLLSSGELAVSSPIGGYATFGPYVTLPKGTYSVELTYRVDSAGNFGHFDVFSTSTGILSKQEIENVYAGEGRTSLTFSVLETSGPWEFRTFVESSKEITINHITLKKIDS